MKRLYSLLFILSTMQLTVVAKTTGIGIPNIFPHMGSGGYSQNPAAGYSRITGYTYLKHTGSVFVPVDSTTYSYSYGRGGQLSADEMDDNFVKFDHSYTYRFIPSKGGYRNEMHRWQTFNTAGKVQTYTIENWDTLVTNNWKGWGRYQYQYNNDLTLLNKTNFEIWYGAMWMQHYQYYNYYNGNNDIVRIQASTMTMYFDYDANKNIISREDSGYNVQGGYWYRHKKSLFSYDANNRIISYIVQVGVNNIWVNSERQEHTYTGNNITTTVLYNWKNSAWELSGRYVKSYDANNNIISDEWQYWDAASSSYKSASRKIWTYNSFHQPLSYYSETYEPSSGIWHSATDDFFYRYYYEPYAPTHVKQFSTEADVRLFPQPAKNILHVNIALNNLQPYTITVFDAYGRTLKQQSNKGNGNEVIDVSDVAAGNYFLKINTQGQQVMKQIVIVK